MLEATRAVIFSNISMVNFFLPAISADVISMFQCADGSAQSRMKRENSLQLKNAICIIPP